MSAAQSKPEYTRKDLPAGLQKLGWLLSGVGLSVVVLGMLTDHRRGSFAALIAFAFLVSVAIGSLFMVAIEYLVGAVWSTPIRRIPEFIASLLLPRFFGMPVPLLLLLGVGLFVSGQHELFHWSHQEAVSGDPILQGKSGYLNAGFFLARLIGYSAVWIFFYLLFTKRSEAQDRTANQELTARNVKAAAIFVPLFAITLSMAGVDWLMSVDPHWFSTIFGVYYFAGTMVATVSAMALATVLLREHGYLHPAMRDDHYYSLGAWMFAFNCFWGYIAFSQFMLIYYSNLPEETFWFAVRLGHGWKAVSLLLMIVHFGLPFLMLISRRAKTNGSWLKLMAVWLLMAHWLDLYWIIMPTYTHGLESGPVFGWRELAVPVLVVGLVLVAFTQKARDTALVPMGDPKLARGLAFRL